jgi:hypothetical protein
MLPGCCVRDSAAGSVGQMSASRRAVKRELGTRRRRLIGFSILALAAIAFAGCGGGGSDSSSGIQVSSGQYGSKWPLTVDHGKLRCEGDIEVIFTAPDGTEYGVNGTALDHGFKDIHPIWAVDPSGLTPKKDIGPLIDKGLSLCK